MRINNNPWWLPGALMVMFGLAIIIFPELLALLVASGFVFVGVMWLSLGWAARKARQNKGGATIYHYERGWF